MARTPPAQRRQHTQEPVQQKVGGFVQRQCGIYRWDIAAPTQEQKQRRPDNSRRIGQSSSYDRLLRQGDGQNRVFGYLSHMAGKLTAGAQQRVVLLESFTNDVGRLNSLVEQFAVAKGPTENINSSIRRLAGQLKLKLMGGGLDAMSQLCGSIEMAAARGIQPAQKTRIFRENVGSLKFQIELAIRTTIREDDEMKAKLKAEKADDLTEEVVE
jgi:hypothetical protein